MVRIALATPDDLTPLVELVDEMNRYYDEPTGDVEAVDAVLSGAAGVELLLAWDGNRAVGLASWSFLWPAAGRSRSIYLKELFVGADHRRAGVGTDLMRALFELAAAEGCSRVEWTTDPGNHDAQEFYDHLGALAPKLFYRVNLPEA